MLSSILEFLSTIDLGNAPITTIYDLFTKFTFLFTIQITQFEK